MTGTNDAPTSTAIANQTSTDAAVVSLNVACHFSDIDATNTLMFTASGLPSGLSINTTTGLISGTIASNATVTGPYSVTVTATDNAGATTSQTFTWTVTNPAPTAVADTGATTENGNASGNVITNDTDPDHDTLNVSAVNGGSGNVGDSMAGTNGGTFTISSTGAYTFNPGAAFDDLAVGQTRTTSIDYTVSDSQGGSSTATLTVTVTGTNDGPTAVGTISGQSNVDSAVVSLNVSSFFTDADTTDVLSFSASGLPTGLSINSSTGVISGTINSSASASGPFSVVVSANDGHGGTVTQSFTWIVTNPAPIANNDSFAIGEDAAATVIGNALTNDSDPDCDAFSANVQTNVAGSNGGVFSIAANGNVTFNPNGAFNNLAAGQTRTTTLNYVITDANGTTSSASITVNVNGANDAPTSTAIANQTSTDAATVSLNVASNFSDPDTTNTLTYSASGLPSGLSINATTGLISGTVANNASVTGPYSVTVTATDNAGVATSQSFTWTVTNPAPTAVNDAGATTENATTSGNVLTNDTDPDNDVLTVSAVNGNGANVGVTVAGTNGGSFTISSTGAYTFSPGTAFDNLAVGQTRTTSVTYTATDSQGGSSSTTLTVTVTGTNDAPVSTALSNQTTRRLQRRSETSPA